MAVQGRFEGTPLTKVPSAATTTQNTLALLTMYYRLYFCYCKAVTVPLCFLSPFSLDNKESDFALV
jgi:hypothetical protein